MNHTLKISFIIFLLAVSFNSFAQEDDTARLGRLQRHVYTLARDEMKGREAGSEEAAIARQYITKEFKEAGLEPYFNGEWTYNFERGGMRYTDVAGIVKGNELENEFIIVGAHYDHLGVKQNGEVYNGADDNASGTAAVIELAKELVARRGELRRSVLLVAFDAEEKGLFGSQALCKLMKENGDMSKVKLMMSIDMVGWYGASGFLKLEGVGTMHSGREIVQELSNADDINLKIKNFETSVFTATDTEAFAKEGIPTLAVTTGLKSPYHKPQDDPELIDYGGLDKVTGYVTDLTEYAARNPEFKSSGKVAGKHMTQPKAFETGFNTYFGSMGMRMNKAAFQTNGGLSIGAGLSGQLNFAAFGIRAEAIYSKQMATLPDASDLYRSSLSFDQSAVTVPLLLIAQTKNSMMRGFIGFGPYYSRILDWTSNDSINSEINQNNWGVQFSFGYYFGRLVLSANSRWQKNLFFTNTAMPAHSYTSECGISYVF